MPDFFSRFDRRRSPDRRYRPRSMWVLRRGGTFGFIYFASACHLAMRTLALSATAGFGCLRSLVKCRAMVLMVALVGTGRSVGYLWQEEERRGKQGFDE